MIPRLARATIWAGPTFRCAPNARQSASQASRYSSHTRILFPPPTRPSLRAGNRVIRMDGVPVAHGSSTALARRRTFATWSDKPDSVQRRETNSLQRQARPLNDSLQELVQDRNMLWKGGWAIFAALMLLCFLKFVGDLLLAPDLDEERVRRLVQQFINSNENSAVNKRFGYPVTFGRRRRRETTKVKVKRKGQFQDFSLTLPVVGKRSRGLADVVVRRKDQHETMTLVYLALRKGGKEKKKSPIILVDHRSV